MGVMVCVFMMLVVVSVMDGFLNQIENSARGMLGDIIIDATTPGGLGYYDDFISELKGMPEVEATAPVIYSFGLLRVDESYTQTVRLVGVRLPEAAAVTAFAKGLHPDDLKRAPRFALPPDIIAALRADKDRLTARVEEGKAEVERLQAAIDAEQAKPADQQNVANLTGWKNDLDAYEQDIADSQQKINLPDQPGLIYGIDIPGISLRDEATGQYTRFLPEGKTVQLMLLPIGRGTVSALGQPVRKPFTVVGDSKTGIYPIDSSYVYVNLETLQNLVDMGAMKDDATGRIDPARCNQIVIKVRGGDDEARLEDLAGRIEGKPRGLPQGPSRPGPRGRQGADLAAEAGRVHRAHRDPADADGHHVRHHLAGVGGADLRDLLHDRGAEDPGHRRA